MRVNGTNAVYLNVLRVPGGNTIAIVDQVKAVPAGTRVGYGGTFVCPRETTLAIVPAGYADGVPRTWSSGGEVLGHPVQMG